MRQTVSNGQGQTRNSFFIFVLVLLLIVSAASVHRVTLWHSLDYFNPHREVGFFRAENALQYRYAEMVGRGDAIPAHDEKLQYPEGLAPYKVLTVGMELAAGWLYRWLGFSQPFHLYAVYFISIFSSLAVIPVGMFATRLWHSRLAGLYAALFYAFAVPAFNRNVGTFLRESFSLPFLFAGTWLIVVALDDDDSGQSCLAALAGGVCMAIGLASWHFARFYLTQFSLILLIIMFFASGVAIKRRRLVLYFLPIYLAGCIVPSLRESLALLSPGFLLGVGAIALSFIAESKPKGIRLGLGSLLFCLPVLVPLVAGGEGGYSHVYETVLSMLESGGVKPDDPAVLTMPVRLLWVGAFTSPELEQVCYSFLWVIPLLCIAGRRITSLYRRGHLSPGMIMVLALAAIYALEYLMMWRFGAIGIFFITLLAGGALAGHEWKVSIRNLVLAGLLLIATAGHLYAGLTFQRGNWIHEVLRNDDAKKSITGVITPNWQNYNVELLRWIRVSTAPDDAFLAPMATSGSILAYTDRPIVVHSKFETAEIRIKYQEYVRALYSDEQKFYDYCLKNQVDYVVHEPGLVLDHDKDSYRYIADSLQLKAKKTVVQMQFFPEKLRHFKLVFQNPNYRIYRVVDQVVSNNENNPYQPLYDPARFAITYGDLSRLDENSVAVAVELENAVAGFRQALQLSWLERFPEAHRLAESVNKRWPNLPHLNGFLCDMNLRRGNLNAANDACSLETEITPFDSETHRMLAEVHRLSGRTMEAQQALQDAAEVERRFYLLSQ